MQMIISFDITPETISCLLFFSTNSPLLPSNFTHFDTIREFNCKKFSLLCLF